MKTIETKFKLKTKGTQTQIFHSKKIDAKIDVNTTGENLKTNTDALQAYR